MGRHQTEINELGVAEQFYSAIGRFISEFSQLEFSFKVYIAETAGLPDEYFDQIMSHDFAMLCTIAENVLPREMDEGRKAQLKALISKCRELNNHRIRVAHGLWVIGAGKLLHVSRQKLETSTHYQRNAGEVAAQADIANDLRSEFERIWGWE